MYNLKKTWFVRIGKGEPILHRFLKIDIAKTSLSFFYKNVDTLTRCKKFLGGESYLVGIILCENQTQQVS